MGWVGTYLVLGGLFGFLGRQLATRLHAVRQKWLEAENKKHSIQSERLRAIYELTSTLTATLSYKRVLNSALDLGFAALNPDPDQAIDDPLVSVVLLFKGGHLQVGSARRFTQADLRVAFPAAEGILQKVFEVGEPTSP